jgi:hypothetical protein
MPETFSPSPLASPLTKDPSWVAWSGWFTQFDQLNPGVLLGRASDLPIGPPQWITLGMGLALTGTELTSTGLGGDVVGPASSTDQALAVWDGTTGALLEDSAILMGASPLLYTGLTFVADTQQGLVRAYGPTFPVAGLADRMAFGGYGDVVLYNSIGSASGASGVTSLRGGGYDTAATQATVDKDGFHVTAALFVTGKTVTVSGNTTLDNWFDQSVKTGASPTFANATINGTLFTNFFDQAVKTTSSPTFNVATVTGLSVNGFTVTVSGAPTLNNWFDQSVKVAASPQFAGLRSTAKVRADTGFNFNGTDGDTFTGLSVALNGGGTNLSFNIKGGIITDGVLTP